MIVIFLSNHKIVILSSSSAVLHGGWRWPVHYLVIRTASLILSPLLLLHKSYTEYTQTIVQEVHTDAQSLFHEWYFLFRLFLYSWLKVFLQTAIFSHNMPIVSCLMVDGGCVRSFFRCKADNAAFGCWQFFSIGGCGHCG